jgi:hypothetical protein
MATQVPSARYGALAQLVRAEDSSNGDPVSREAEEKPGEFKETVSREARQS